MCAKTTKPTRSIVYLSNSRQGKRVAQEFVVAVDCVWCVFFSITFWLFQLETRERGEFTAKEMCLSKAQNWVDKYRFCCLIEGDNEYKSVITSVGPWLTKSKTSSSPSSLWYINTKKQREREGLDERITEDVVMSLLSRLKQDGPGRLCTRRRIVK